MREYRVKKVTGEPNWESLPFLSIDIPYETTPPDISAYAQVCYNDEELLVHLFCEEPYTRAEETGPLASPCVDSCLEFFFSPDDGDHRYFNIEFNSLGAAYLGFGNTSVKDLVRLLPVKGSVSELLNAKINKYEGGWEIFYRVPYSFIRRFFKDFKVYEGKVMRANCYKCSDYTTPPHYLAWNDVGGEPLSFHRPNCFGRMIFE